MTQEITDLPGGHLISRRTLFGLVFVAGVIAPLIGSASAAHADTGGYEEEEYEIPDDIGSAPWW